MQMHVFFKGTKDTNIIGDLKVSLKVKECLR